jgi:PST family polysaccharide transporter
VLIFVFIRSEADYLIYPIIMSLGPITASIVGLYIVFKRHQIKFILPKKSILKFYFIDSIPIFSSNLSLKMYLGSNKVIIGSFLSMQDVAYYDLGEKFLNLLKIPITIISQVLFPKMAHSFNKYLIMKLIKIIAFGTIVLTLFLEYFSLAIIKLFAGVTMLGATTAVNILLLSVTPLIISNLLGVQTLLAKGYNKEFFKVVFSSLVVYLSYIALCYLINALNLYSICISYVIVEVYMLIHFYVIIKKLKLLK